MRIILKIAKLELRYLFYSPIGWFLAIAMLVLTAYLYTGPMVIYAASTEMLQRNNPQPLFLNIDQSLTYNLFNRMGVGLFFDVMAYLPLFVPLIAMSVINKEFNNGTVRLLYSSPVKLRQILLGKYLGLVVYNFILIMIIGIFVLLGCFDLAKVDLPPLFAGLFGLFLVLNTLTAIALFMSSLSNYQIVSALASFTVLVLLSSIQSVWQEYDFFRDITFFLAISQKITRALAGMLTSSDILYYLIVIFMFVGFTYLRMKHGTETKPWYVRAGRYIGLIVACMLFGYIFSRPATTLYWDTTAQQLHTIHPKSQALVKELNEGPLEITLYVNLLDAKAMHGLPRRRNGYLENVWRPYQRFKTDINYKYVYYYGVRKGDSSLFKKYPGKSLLQIAGIKAKSLQVDSSMFKPAGTLSNLKDLEAENLELMMTLEYKGKKIDLRTHSIPSPWPEERNINAALSRMLNRHIPQVYFVSGQLERNIYKKGEREFSLHSMDKINKDALINSGFDADTLNLSEKDIPQNTSLLVVADPRMDYPAPVMNKLSQYMERGGNMLILGESGKQHVLNPLLSYTGLQLENGQLVQVNKHETPEKITAYVNPAAYTISEERSMRLAHHLWSNGFTEDSMNFQLRAATGLTGSAGNNFKASPLLLTAPGKAWLKQGKLVVDSTAPAFNPAEGDRKQHSWPLITQLTRMVDQREQRIIVSSDADIISNQGLYGGSATLLYSMYSWSVYNKFPIYTYRPQAEDDLLSVSSKRAYIQKLLFTWVVPSLVLIAGAIILIRRKRK